MDTKYKSFLDNDFSSLIAVVVVACGGCMIAQLVLNVPIVFSYLRSFLVSKFELCKTWKQQVGHNKLVNCNIMLQNVTFRKSVKKSSPVVSPLAVLRQSQLLTSHLQKTQLSVRVLRREKNSKCQKNYVI